MNRDSYYTRIKTMTIQTQGGWRFPNETKSQVHLRPLIFAKLQWET